MLKDPDERLLGQVGRIRFVLQRPEQIMEELLGMALHEIIQGGVMAGRQPCHGLRILVVAVGWIHGPGATRDATRDSWDGGFVPWPGRS